MMPKLPCPHCGLTLGFFPHSRDANRGTPLRSPPFADAVLC